MRVEKLAVLAVFLVEKINDEKKNDKSNFKCRESLGISQGHKVDVVDAMNLCIKI
jgi:hypothetical protein